MDDSQATSRWRTVGTFVAIYVAWLVTSVLSVGVMITWHTTLVRLYVRAQWDKYSLAFYNDMVILALVTLWLVLVIGSESWYRAGPGAGAGVLRRRVVRLLVALMLIGMIGIVLGRVL